MSQGHVALVTGASRGIGAEVARNLGRRGVHVLVGARGIEACRGVAEAIRAEGGQATALALDVTDSESIAAAVDAGREAAGTIDWLVNNAGIAISAPLLAERDAGGPVGDDDLYEAHLQINFHGARRVGEALLPGMIEAGGGCIVQVASSAALVGYPYVAAYCASKHALLGYSRAAALELSRKRVAVQVLCPHYVDSPMTVASIENIVRKTGQSAEEARAFLEQQNPGGVLVTEGEVAEAVWELLSARRTGVVRELIGGGERTVEAGLELAERAR